MVVIKSLVTAEEVERESEVELTEFSSVLNEECGKMVGMKGDPMF